MALALRDIKRLCFDVMWKIDEVEIPCAGARIIKVFFGADEVKRESEWAPLPPTRKQIETLMYVASLPNNFIKNQSQSIREYFRSLLESKKYIGDSVINLFKIEEYCHVREIIIPYVKSARKHNFIISCSCDWEQSSVLNLLCRDDKILKVNPGEMS